MVYSRPFASKAVFWAILKEFELLGTVNGELRLFQNRSKTINASVSSPLKVLLQTEMADFPTLSYISTSHRAQRSYLWPWLLIAVQFFGWYHALTLLLYCKIEHTVIQSNYKPGNILSNALKNRWRPIDCGRIFLLGTSCFARKASPFGRPSFPPSIR